MGEGGKGAWYESKRNDFTCLLIRYSMCSQLFFSPLSWILMIQKVKQICSGFRKTHPILIDL